ncbi:hypothetical protein JW933_04220 [candidate division FCPU426 bacterium]|nr:hypothetical protein [candidate division FCPU426 bacterium]
MAFSLKELKNKWVASLAEGRLLGRVQTAFVDGSRRKMTGIRLHVNHPGPGSRRNWVSVEKIRKVGVDLIYIPEAGVLTESPSPGRSWEQMLGMTVNSKDGRMLGKLEDIVIQSSTWLVGQLCLSGNRTLAVDSPETTIGQDMILVQAAIQAKPVRSKTVTADSRHATLRGDIYQQTAKVVERGEALVQQTGKAITRLLQGQEKEATGKGFKKTSGRSRSSARPATAAARKRGVRPGSGAKKKIRAKTGKTSARAKTGSRKK